MSAAGNGSIRRAVVENARRARSVVVKNLARDFNIADPEGLREAIDTAAEIYESAEFDSQQGREREIKQLKQLNKQLPKTLELLWELRSAIVVATSRRIFGEDALVRENYGKVALSYTDMLDQLEKVGAVAHDIPPRRRGRGKRKARGGVDLDPLRALMKVLAEGYWKGTLRREFDQNHNAQGWNGNKPSRKAPAAQCFCYRVIEHIAPGRGAFLKTIGREHDGDGLQEIEQQRADLL